MVILYIPRPDIPLTLGWTHDATDWQIASAPTFKDDEIVIESRSDQTHLTSIVFDIELDPEKTYYSRARVICNKGIFEWSHVDIIKPTDFIKVAFDHPIPSIVMKPNITLNGDPTNFPASLFTIDTTPISTTSNAEHESTTYIIEEIDGTPVYVKLDDRDDLTHKQISDIKLEEGKLYIIKVAHRSTSNDVSEFAEQLVYVRNIPEIQLKSTTEAPTIDDGYTVVIEPVISYKRMYVTLHKVGINNEQQVYSGSTTAYSLVIPASAFDQNKVSKYLLTIDVEKEDGSRTGKKFYIINLDVA